MIQIIPAIDVIDGKSVRLRQGDYETSQEMALQPRQALAFYSQFSQVARIHVVDLIGARERSPQQAQFIADLAAQSTLPLQIGGGLRSAADLEYYAQAGVSYFIVGTRAITDPKWLAAMVKTYPGRIFLGLDARENRLYINGWTQASAHTFESYLPLVENLDLAGIIYTDIARDGMESGPNVERTAALQKLTDLPVVASGGVRSRADLEALAEAGIGQAIVGKAAHSKEFWREIR
ncbi:1-(5-phosphoribosyl)-5-[(5-phosphoribosylamino)methylideneamino] imidazole-4-carboxamide isomerase [Actinobaculum suis]|uniref:1-(5-phosphoribosyl)-5-[(5- phosphoribosylamino)methylideneamino]imidazole-4- carboxamide isomerase n=1 Tax=Actinobaculum suis TaxID=1657 RepID=UPI0006A143ED|nr:1-(5-phosphoribosyl)-5-[(5-phosphoribosylamino)methylideneamino] imidazole-4-carboxamide isomerase [Actinobaculum suis]KMY23784.1 1-(5-phosphoribosyl)-5-[(5-phosphoribosylamino)methylideneamino] imidazole-4-carboxamide isomerase [Actinobaculum suis]